MQSIRSDLPSKEELLKALQNILAILERIDITLTLRIQIAGETVNAMNVFLSEYDKFESPNRDKILTESARLAEYLLQFIRWEMDAVKLVEHVLHFTSLSLEETASQTYDDASKNPTTLLVKAVFTITDLAVHLDHLGTIIVSGIKHIVSDHVQLNFPNDISRIVFDVSIRLLSIEHILRDEGKHTAVIFLDAVIELLGLGKNSSCILKHIQLPIHVIETVKQISVMINGYKGIDAPSVGATANVTNILLNEIIFARHSEAVQILLRFSVRLMSEIRNHINEGGKLPTAPDEAAILLLNDAHQSLGLVKNVRNIRMDAIEIAVYLAGAVAKFVCFFNASFDRAALKLISEDLSYINDTYWHTMFNNSNPERRDVIENIKNIRFRIGCIISIIHNNLRRA